MKSTKTKIEIVKGLFNSGIITTEEAFTLLGEKKDDILELTKEINIQNEKLIKLKKEFYPAYGC